MSRDTAAWNPGELDDGADRPEYVTCVTDSARCGYSLCGRFISWSFAFLGPDHARMTEASGSRLMICPECRAKMPVERPAG
jgi:hypothetical protein